MSTKLCNSANKTLSNWNELILRAKKRVLEMKRAIRTFEELRDRGMECPEPTFESETGLLGQKGDLGQSRSFQKRRRTRRRVRPKSEEFIYEQVIQRSTGR